MTTWTLQAPMAEMTLAGGMIIRFEAIDPTTGNAVTGVDVTDVAVYGYDRSGGTAQLEDVVPLYTPQDVGAPGAVSV